jgi:hypothetical protein
MSLLHKSGKGPLSRNRRPLDLDELRRALEAETPCGYFFKHLQLEKTGGALVVSGKLPNYTLQEHLLARLSGLARGFPIENRTVVVNAQGLSSECERQLQDEAESKLHRLANRIRKIK